MKKEQFLILLGKKIASLRQERGLSQTELALRCDKDRQNLNRLEKGKINPSIFFLLQISIELNITLAELLSFDYTSIINGD